MCCTNINCYFRFEDVHFGPVDMLLVASLEVQQALIEVRLKDRLTVKDIMVTDSLEELLFTFKYFNVKYKG